MLALFTGSTPVLLVVNKLDKAKDKLALQVFIDNCRAEYEFADVEVVSAKHGHRLAELLAKVRPYLPESPPLYPEDMITDRSRRFWQRKSCVKNCSAIWVRNCPMR